MNYTYSDNTASLVDLEFIDYLINLLVEEHISISGEHLNKAELIKFIESEAEFYKGNL